MRSGELLSDVYVWVLMSQDFATSIREPQKLFNTYLLQLAVSFPCYIYISSITLFEVRKKLIFSRDSVDIIIDRLGN